MLENLNMTVLMKAEHGYGKFLATLETKTNVHFFSCHGEILSKSSHVMNKLADSTLK